MKKLAAFLSIIAVLFAISIFINTLSLAGNNYYNEIALSSLERGNQVDNVTGHFLLSTDPNSPTILILGFNGTFGNASGAWILDTYYASDLQKATWAANAFVVVKYIPRLTPPQAYLKERAKVLIYVNGYLAYEEKLTHIIPSYADYGLTPPNSSKAQVLASDGVIKVRIPTTLLSSDRTEVKLEVQSNATWEVDLIGIVVKLSAPFWLQNLPIVILGVTLATISLILCLRFFVKNIAHKGDRLVQLLLIAGFVIRIGLAPFTQDDWDLPYFRNASLMYYLVGINPLSIWTYGVGWLGILLSYSSIGLVLQQLFLKDICSPYMLNLFVKLPSILADMLIPSLIHFYRKNLGITDIAAKYIMVLWIFNPYTIFVSSVWGQFDVIPTLLMLLSLISLIKGSIFNSALLLGLGSLFKFFPILLLPLICIALLKSRGIKYLALYITLTGLVVAQQAIAYYVFAPDLFISIMGYRAGVGQWGEYYQGLTYLNLLWRYGFTKYLHPSPFLTLYAGTLAMIFLIAWYKKRNIFEITKSQNIFTLALLSLIPFFLSYNMVNQQYIMWILPILMLLGYGYGTLPKRILDLINAVLIIATASYLITPIRAFRGFPAFFDLMGLSFSIMLLSLITFVFSKPYKQELGFSKMHYAYAISALATIFIPMFLCDVPLWLATVCQITSTCIALSFLFYHLYFCIRSSSLIDTPHNLKRVRLILALFYVYVSLQIAFVGSSLQSISVMKPIFETAFHNWIPLPFSVNSIMFRWLQIIVLPQILLSISALSAALLCILRTKSSIYSIITPWLIVSYIIVYVIHTPTGYSALRELASPLILIATHLLAFFMAIFRGGKD